MAEELRDIVNDAGVIKLCTVHMRRLVDDVLALSKIGKHALLSHGNSNDGNFRQQHAHRYAHSIAPRVHVSGGYGHFAERNAHPRHYL